MGGVKHALWIAAATAAASLVLGAGCGGPEEAGEGGAAGPRPEAPLTGGAQVRTVTEGTVLPPGAGAEGAVGDYLLENAAARFVVGAPGRLAPAPMYGGSLIDAATADGQDYLRALVPHVGAPDAPGVVCDEVTIPDPAQSDERVTLRVSGHIAGKPDVRVKTTYELSGTSPRLTIVTEVMNGTGADMPEVALGDMVFHGRTERFVRGIGLEPVGASGETDGFSAFGAHGAFAVREASGQGMQVQCGHGFSWLTYTRVAIPAGESRTCRRVVTVHEREADALGWEEASAAGKALSNGMVRIAEIGSEKPVVGAYVMFASQLGAPALLAATDEAGEAAAQLPEGNYGIVCFASDRSPIGLPVGLPAGGKHQVGVSMSAASGMRIRVREDTPGGLRPTAARVTLQAVSSMTPAPRGGVPAPGACTPRTIILPPGEEVFVPLSPAEGRLPGTYRVTASKGPLYGLAEAQVEAVPGRTASVELTIKRVVQPGYWVALDFSQLSSATPESPLSRQERELLNEAEGLDGGVVMQDWPGVLAADGGGALTPALRISNGQAGGFFVVPLPPDVSSGEIALAPPGLWGSSAEEQLQSLRAFFPTALFCIERPPAAEGARQEISPHFDAMVVLRGGDTLEATDRLKAWFHLLNQGRRVVAVGGSAAGSGWDAHSLGARTYLLRDSADASEPGAAFSAAIRSLVDHPAAFVSNGPFLEVTADGAQIGSTLHPKAGSVALRVKVLAPGWVDVSGALVFFNGRPVSELKPTGRDGGCVLDRTVNLPVERDGWIVVLVQGQRGMAPVYADQAGVGAVPFAVTNPFWVDADGDGVVRVQDGTGG